MNSVFAESWPLETIIWTATFPSSLTGANLAVFSSAFSYLADVTSVEDRTMRIAILDGVYLLSMPTGIAAGKFLAAGSSIHDRTPKTGGGVSHLPAVLECFWHCWLI